MPCTEAEDCDRRSGSTLAVLRTAPIPVGTAALTDALDSGASLNFGDGYLGQHRIFTECAGAHVVQDLFAFIEKPRRAIGHEACALCRRTSGTSSFADLI